VRFISSPVEYKSSPTMEGIKNTLKRSFQTVLSTSEVQEQDGNSFRDTSEKSKDTSMDFVRLGMPSPSIRRSFGLPPRDRRSVPFTHLPQDFNTSRTQRTRPTAYVMESSVTEDGSKRSEPNPGVDDPHATSQMNKPQPQDKRRHLPVQSLHFETEVLRMFSVGNDVTGETIIAIAHPHSIVIYSVVKWVKIITKRLLTRQ